MNDIVAELEESLSTVKKSQFRKVGEFVIGGLKNGHIQVNGYLFYNTIEEIPKERINNELNKVKEKFFNLMDQSQKFKQYALKTGIDFHLVLDDPHNSGISICAEIDGVYKEFI